MQFERKCRIVLLEYRIYIDVVLKGTPLIQATPFIFEPKKPIEVMSFDETTGKWMKVWAVWPGPEKGALSDPGNIKIKCRDSEMFDWDAPLREFLNPKLFTTVETIK